MGTKEVNIAAYRNVTIRLPLELHNALKEVAKTNDTTLTQLSAEYLENAVRMQALVPGATFLMPELTRLLLTYFDRHEERVLKLITRAATDAAITKRLLMHSMIEFTAYSEEKVDFLEGEAYKAVSRSLYRPLESIENLLAELRQARS